MVKGDSEAFESIAIKTSISMPEANDAATDATDKTPGSGLFLMPSTVSGRAADVSGLPLGGTSIEGKVGFLTDVTMTDISTDTLTVTKGDVTQATSPATAVTITGGASSGTITTQALTAVAGATHTFTMNNVDVLATSNIFLSIKEYTGAGIPTLYMDTVAAGSVNITIANAHSANALDAAAEISYLIV